MFQLILPLALTFTAAAAAADSVYDAAFDHSTGTYRLDRARSTSDCEEPAEVRVYLSDGRDVLFVQSLSGPGGHALDLKESESWDNVYDLYLLWEFRYTMARGRRIWKTQTTVGVLGFERDVKTFSFVDADHFEFREWSRTLHWDYADLKDRPSICHYARSL